MRGNRPVIFSAALSLQSGGQEHSCKAPAPGKASPHVYTSASAMKVRARKKH